LSPAKNLKKSSDERLYRQYKKNFIDQLLTPMALIGHKGFVVKWQKIEGFPFQVTKKHHDFTFILF